jgi:hypothetical protein
MSESSSAAVVKSKKPPKSRELIWIYRFTSFLCIFMVVWILVFPSSLLVEHSSWHRDSVNRLNDVPGSIVSPDLLTKYQGHYMVQGLHILPGAAWAVLVPIQMHSQVRKRYRAAHTYLGYVFGGLSVLIGVGVVAIFMQQLSYEHFYPDLEPLPWPGGSPGLLVLTLYFVGAMIWSIYQAAVPRNHHLHRQWMVRHVAAGLWIALQRILLSTALNCGLSPPVTRAQQRAIFPFSGMLAIVITIALGERAVYLLNLQQAEKMERKRAAKAKVQ